MNTRQVLQFMRRSGRPEDALCYKYLLEYLLSSNKDIFYYSDFERAVNSLELKDPLQSVQRCLNFLKSEGVGLLRQEYRYLDSDDVIYEPSIEEIQDAFKTGELHLSSLNITDPDFKSKLYIVFRRGEGRVS